MKIVVVSPHRDDAAFSLALSVSSWLQAGHEVQVLNCFTRSAYAPYSDAESLHPNDRTSFVSATRAREDVAWNKMIGGKLRITDLDLLDAPLRLVCGVEEVLSMEVRPGDRAVARVKGAIAKLARAGSAIVLPLAIGGHIDHLVSRQAGVEALTEEPYPVAFYEDLPYAARPEGTGEPERISAHLELALQPGFVHVEVGDPGSHVSRKRLVVECYDSQIDSSVAEQIASFCLRYDGRERLWVNDAWSTAFDSQPHKGKSA